MSNDLHRRIDESVSYINQFAGAETFEHEVEESQFLDAIGSGVGAMIELVQSGQATKEQETALADFLSKYEVM